MTGIRVDPPPCMLAYRFSTAPAPLQVSGPSQASPGRVNVWLSPPDGQPVYSDKILVAVPVGDQPNQFSTVAPTLTPNTERWAASGAVMGTGEEVGLVPVPGVRYATFTLTCQSVDHQKIDYRLVFSVTTTSVNPHADTFPFRVVEYSAPTEHGPFVPRAGTFTLAKAPAELYLTNLVTGPAGPAEAPLPRTRFLSGEAIRFRWESNGSRFSLYQGGRRDPVWTGVDTSWTLTPGAATDTTFTLVATMADSPARISGTTTVTIADPTSTPRSTAPDTLTVTGPSTLTGNARLGNAAVAGRLSVTAHARLAATTAPSVTVTGPAELPYAMLNATNVTGTIGGGPLGLTDATLGTLFVNTWFTGMVARPLNPGQGYVASSDSLVAGTVFSDQPGTAAIATRISAMGNGAVVSATGGSTLVWQSGGNRMFWGTTGSFLLFVPKGGAFSVWITDRFARRAPVAFRFYPLARNAVLREVDAAAHAMEQPPDPDPRPRRRRDPDRVDDVVDAFATLAGDRLTPGLRRRAATALAALFATPTTDQEGLR